MQPSIMCNIHILYTREISGNIYTFICNVNCYDIWHVYVAVCSNSAVADIVAAPLIYRLGMQQ